MIDKIQNAIATALAVFVLAGFVSVAALLPENGQLVAGIVGGVFFLPAYATRKVAGLFS